MLNSFIWVQNFFSCTQFNIATRLTISCKWRFQTCISFLIVIYFNKCPDVPSNMVSPQISKNFFTTVFERKRSTFSWDFILFIVILTLIKNRNFGSIYKPSSACNATVYEHDFFFRKNTLPRSINKLLALNVKSDSATSWRTNLFESSNVPPWL